MANLILTQKTIRGGFLTLLNWFIEGMQKYYINLSHDLGKIEYFENHIEKSKR